MLNRLFITSSIVVLASACTTPTSPAQTAATDTVVCADTSVDSTCDYVGVSGLQKAVDAAESGETIRIAAGMYTPTAYRDVPFEDLVVRGALVIDGKEISINADSGAILKGDRKHPLSAIVIRQSDVDISHLYIADFYYFEPEDDIYDGHGIFSIDSKVALDGVKIEGVSKMAVTGRGDARIAARELSIQESHLGVWLEEFATIDIHTSDIVGSESAAIAAYGDSKAQITNSLVDGNLDDGLYTENRAEILSLRTRILNNAPFGARAADESKIVICDSILSGNTTDVGEEGKGRIQVDDPLAC